MASPSARQAEVEMQEECRRNLWNPLVVRCLLPLPAPHSCLHSDDCTQGLTANNLMKEDRERERWRLPLNKCENERSNAMMNKVLRYEQGCKRQIKQQRVQILFSMQEQGETDTLFLLSWKVKVTQKTHKVSSLRQCRFNEYCFERETRPTVFT